MSQIRQTTRLLMHKRVLLFSSLVLSLLIITGAYLLNPFADKVKAHTTSYIKTNQLNCGKSNVYPEDTSLASPCWNIAYNRSKVDLVHHTQYTGSPSWFPDNVFSAETGWMSNQAPTNADWKVTNRQYWLSDHEFDRYRNTKPYRVLGTGWAFDVLSLTETIYLRKGFYDYYGSNVKIFKLLFTDLCFSGLDILQANSNPQITVSIKGTEIYKLDSSIIKQWSEGSVATLNGQHRKRAKGHAGCFHHRDSSPLRGLSSSVALTKAELANILGTLSIRKFKGIDYIPVEVTFQLKSETGGKPKGGTYNLFSYRPQVFLDSISGVSDAKIGSNAKPIPSSSKTTVLEQKNNGDLKPKTLSALIVDSDSTAYYFANRGMFTATQPNPYITPLEDATRTTLRAKKWQMAFETAVPINTSGLVCNQNQKIYANIGLYDHDYATSGTKVRSKVSTPIKATIYSTNRSGYNKATASWTQVETLTFGQYANTAKYHQWFAQKI